jgi:cold shock protein
MAVSLSLIAGRTFRPSQTSTSIASGHAIGVTLSRTATDYSERTTPMTKGTVKFYNEQKGFGFIQPDDGGKDVFVHATALERAGISRLFDGQKIFFDIELDSLSGKTAVANIEAA